MNTDNVQKTSFTMTRRTLLAGIPATAFLLAGCSTSSSTSSGSTAVATQSPAADGTVAAYAQAFQATLSDELQATLVQDYTLANAELWSNLPQALIGGGGGTGDGTAPGGDGTMPSGGPDDGGFGDSSDAPDDGGAGGGGGSAGARIGIDLGQLDDDQLASFFELLQAATGTGDGVGYDQLLQALNADDYLAENGGGDTYGRENFYVAFLGAPGDSGTWEFQFGGHHMAVANTYTDGVLVGATPSFRGIEPNGDFEWDGETDHPMAVKEAAFAALLAGLDDDQLSSAELSDVYSDLLLGPGNDWSFPTDKEGVQASGFTDDQKALLLDAIASYVNDISDAEAADILSTYESEIDDTYVAYSGTTALTERNDYIRIDGPSVWIEFSMQSGIVLSGNHPHSVWRDRNTDYGGTQS